MTAEPAQNVQTAGARWGWAALRLLLGVGLLAAVLWWLQPSWPQVRARAQPDWGFLGLGLLGTAAGTAAASGRWKLLSETLGPTRLPFSAYFHLFALNRVLAQFLPAVLVDVVGRSVTLRAAGSEDAVGRLGTIVILERVLDIVLPATILAWAIAIHGSGLGPAATWGSFAVAMVLFAVVGLRAFGPLTGLALRVYARLRPNAITHEAPPALPSAVVGRVVALTLARYAAIVVQFWGLGVGIGVAIDLPTVLMASPVAQLASIIAITPGGLGFQDGGWAAALDWLGLHAVATSLFVLAARFGMLAGFAILTVLTWGAGRRRGRR